MILNVKFGLFMIRCLVATPLIGGGQFNPPAESYKHQYPHYQTTGKNNQLTNTFSQERVINLEVTRDDGLNNTPPAEIWKQVLFSYTPC